MKYIIALLLYFPIVSFAQPKQDSLWLPSARLSGNGQVTQKVNPGKASMNEAMSLHLTKKFIEVKNKSSYPPSKENQKGDIHEDHGFIS